MFSANSQSPTSWGRYPKVKSKEVVPLYWRNELPDLASFDESVLPYGYGRSYGDSCLNDSGVSLDVSRLTNFIAFDEETGLLKCEAGVSLADVLEWGVPRGWFLPVSPGTKFVSVGGAIANDVHGKNHHSAGTFGCHVTQFELLRSTGEHIVCSPTQNTELFRATIGGLGLTGIIIWAEFRLKRIVNPYIDSVSIRFESLDEFFELSAEVDQKYEFSVSWTDMLIGEPNTCRGKFSAGNHNQDPELAKKPLKKSKLPLALPFDLSPLLTVNTLSIKAFNELYYRMQGPKRVEKTTSYEPFFYPLDAIHDWNRMYGSRGFFQYQFVIPFEQGREGMHAVMRYIAQHGEGSFLNVLKEFGSIKSPGMLSFPRPGVNLAVDFANRGRHTMKFLDELDRVVEDYGGAFYPAKDARMSSELFKKCYPEWEEFQKYIDPKFSSSFWRRIMNSPVTPALA
jgi:FAD/FMN-containing dehydrogenases